MPFLRLARHGIQARCSALPFRTLLFVISVAVQVILPLREGHTAGPYQTHTLLEKTGAGVQALLLVGFSKCFEHLGNMSSHH
jgi:hypothetical protein